MSADDNFVSSAMDVVVVMIVSLIIAGGLSLLIAPLLVMYVSIEVGLISFLVLPIVVFVSVFCFLRTQKKGGAWE